MKKTSKRKKKGSARRGGAKCARFNNRKTKTPPRRRALTSNARRDHFARHTEVKPKNDKKQTVNELASRKGALQKANGWKVVHLTTQMDEVSNLEDTVKKRLSALQNSIEEKPDALQMKPLDTDEQLILSKIKQLTEGCIQRSKMLQDQVCQAKQKMLKVLEHKPRIVDIIGKYKNKRALNNQGLKLKK